MRPTVATGDEATATPAAREDVPGRGASSGRFAVARLVLVVGGGLLLAIALHGLPVLVVVLALVVMVMVHELGHFVTAKLSGMKVTEYFLGFGPRIWSFRRGETEYGVKAIPAGGYVRIVGMTALEEVDPGDEARSYRQSSFPRRLLVSMAGSAMHFVMAFVLLWAMFAVAGMPVLATPEITGVTSFASGPSPAQLAGLRPGDEILAVDGRPVTQGEQFVSYVQSHAGDELALLVRRGSRDITVHVRPANKRKVDVIVHGKTEPLLKAAGPPVGVIGVDLGFLTRNETVNPLVAVGRATTTLGSVTAATASGMATVFSFHGLSTFAHQVATAGSTAKPATTASGAPSSASAGSSGSSSSGQLLSILGAVEIGAQAARQNVSELLYILVAINIFVGMVNLFPMLPLDGGHVVIAVYERIRSRRGRPYHADVAKLMPVAYVFLLFMVVLGVGALYANIVQPASLPGS
ncbi:MAG: M50 family metallopeptidase [Acidimicrobiales bacterium]